MDVTPTATNPMGPPLHSSPEEDQHTELPNGNTAQQSRSHSVSTAPATTSPAQPKMINNTAFIGKLYKYVNQKKMRGCLLTVRSMLEDTSIRDLIVWAADGEGFLMSPSADFGKVLS